MLSLFKVWYIIRTSHLLIHDTFVGSRPTIRSIPLPPTYLALKATMFFKIGVFLVITGCKRKKRNVRFLIWSPGVTVCSRLVVVSVCLLVVRSLLLVVCGHIWSFASGLWSFVIVCGRCLFKLLRWIWRFVIYLTKLIWTLISRLSWVTKKALKKLHWMIYELCVDTIDINISIDTISLSDLWEN